MCSYIYINIYISLCVRQHWLWHLAGIAASQDCWVVGGCSAKLATCFAWSYGEMGMSVGGCTQPSRAWPNYAAYIYLWTPERWHAARHLKSWMYIWPRHQIRMGSHGWVERNPKNSISKKTSKKNKDHFDFGSWDLWRDLSQVLPSRFPRLPLGSGGPLGANVTELAQLADHVVFNHLVPWISVVRTRTLLSWPFEKSEDRLRIRYTHLAMYFHVYLL